MIVTADNQPHFRQLSRSVGAVGLLAKENLLALRMLLTREMDVNKSGVRENNDNERD
jgi:hypothetical protein